MGATAMRLDPSPAAAMEASMALEEATTPAPLPWFGAQLWSRPAHTPRATRPNRGCRQQGTARQYVCSTVHCSITAASCEADAACAATGREASAHASTCTPPTSSAAPAGTCTA